MTAYLAENKPKSIISQTTWVYLYTMIAVLTNLLSFTIVLLAASLAVLIIQSNGVNCDTENDELIFQRIAAKFVVDGDEYYADAVDYKHVGSSEDWHHYVIRWTDECEKFDPNFTEFKEDSSYNS